MAYRVKEASVRYQRATFGFTGRSPLGFRFLFQLYIVKRLHNHRVDDHTKAYAEETMKTLYESVLAGKGDIK